MNLFPEKQGIATPYQAPQLLDPAHGRQTRKRLALENRRRTVRLQGAGSPLLKGTHVAHSAQKPPQKLQVRERVGHK